MHHLIELLVELGFNLFLKHRGQKTQLSLQVQPLASDGKLAIHAIAAKVQHIVRIAVFIAALHAKFGSSFMGPGLGMLPCSGQTQRMGAFNQNMRHVGEP